MNRLQSTLHKRLHRKRRVRAVVHGTAARPRLTVFISNRHITAQLIDDDASKTLAYATTVGAKDSGTGIEQAKIIGASIAKKGKAAKVNTVVFDRNGRLYHGRVQALADAARENGMEF